MIFLFQTNKSLFIIYLVINKLRRSITASPARHIFAGGAVWSKCKKVKSAVAGGQAVCWQVACVQTPRWRSWPGRDPEIIAALAAALHR